LQDGGDAVHDGHETGADGTEEGLDARNDGSHFEIVALRDLLSAVELVLVRSRLVVWKIRVGGIWLWMGRRVVGKSRQNK
jgi:hypothetical protein